MSAGVREAVGGGNGLRANTGGSECRWRGAVREGERAQAPTEEGWGAQSPFQSISWQSLNGRGGGHACVSRQGPHVHSA